MSRSRIRLLPAAALATAAGATTAALALAPAAQPATDPCLLTEASRIHTVAVNLDRDDTKERVDVFNFDAAAAPVTMFQVCDKRRGEFVRTQRATVNESPGSSESGLVSSWVGDLNLDKRDEIAVRDFVTPSVGELLSIYRQSTRYALTFRLVQHISGDETKLVRGRPGTSATVTVRLKANHARDGSAHTEHWTYDKSRGKWVCASDCGGR